MLQNNQSVHLRFVHFFGPTLKKKKASKLKQKWVTRVGKQYKRMSEKYKVVGEYLRSVSL